MENIIELTKEFVKEELKNSESGHDWWHAYRVWKLSKYIARKEKCKNKTDIELAALLHDIADSKFHKGNETIGAKKASSFLEKNEIDKKIIEDVKYIINNISFKKTLENKKIRLTKELAIVMDADRLDALGAIGIARTFSYGGHKGTVMYDPKVSPKINMSKEEYKKHKGTTINHFYEKLFLLKVKMNTRTGKRIANKRHKFMKKYLKEFYKEWNLK